MRIGIDASRANARHRTGTEWYSFFLLREFAHMQTPHQLVAYTREPLRDDMRFLENHLEVRVLSWPPKRLWTQLRLSGEMLTHPPDRLFVPAHTIPIIHPSRTITTLHDVGFLRHPELYSRTELLYHRWSAQHAIRTATHILTISEFSKKEIQSAYHLADQHITAIPLGYDERRYHHQLDHHTIERVRTSYDMHDRPYFFSLGRLEWKKNTDGMIKAYAHAKREGRFDHQLVLAGQPGNGFPEIRDSIKKHHVQKDVRMLGWVQDADVPYLMAGAEAFLFPSRYEGFGIPVIEAMAVGTPVITSRVASLPEVAGDAALLVSPASTEEISIALQRIVRDSTLASSLREKGLQRAQHYQWKHCAAATLSALTRSYEES